MKKIGTILLIILFLGFATCEPVDIQERSYAKGKPQTVKTKSLKCESLGEFTLTAYCGCSRCCGKSNGKTATGVKAKANHTIAVDPKTIPYGTEVLINGQKYVAEDCGSAVKGKHIDIFFSTHKEAVKFGKQKAEVFKIPKRKILSRLKLFKTKIKGEDYGKQAHVQFVGNRHRCIFGNAM